MLCDAKFKILFRRIGFLNLPEIEKHSEKKFNFWWLLTDIRASKTSITCEDADLPVEMLNKIFLSTLSLNGLNRFLIISITMKIFSVLIYSAFLQRMRNIIFFGINKYFVWVHSEFLPSYCDLQSIFIIKKYLQIWLFNYLHLTVLVFEQTL